MANFTVSELVSKGAEYVASLAKCRSLQADDKSVVEQALKQLGKDANGDGSIDVNDYSDTPAMSNKEYQKLVAKNAPAKTEENKENGRNQAKENMDKTHGQTDDRDYNSEADFGQYGGYASSGLSAIGSGISGLAGGAKDAAKAGTEAFKTTVQASNQAVSATTEAGKQAAEATAKSAEEAGKEAGKQAGKSAKLGLAGAIISLAAAGLDTAMAGVAISSANAMEGKNAPQAEDTKTNMAAAAEAADAVDAGLETMAEIEEEIQAVTDEAVERTEDFNDEAEGVHEEDAQNSAVLNHIAKKIEDGTADAEEIKVYEELTGVHDENSETITGLAEENISANEESDAAIAELASGYEDIKTNNDVTRGVAEEHKAFAEKNLENAQKDLEASQKMEQNAKVAMGTNFASLATDTLSSVKDFSIGSALMSNIFTMAAGTTYIVAGGLEVGAAALEGAAGGMQIAAGSKSAANSAEQNANIETFSNGAASADALTANVDYADAEYETSFETTTENYDLVQNTETETPEMENYEVVSGKRSEGSEKTEDGDDKDKEKPELTAEL